MMIDAQTLIELLQLVRACKEFETRTQDTTEPRAATTTRPDQQAGKHATLRGDATDATAEPGGTNEDEADTEDTTQHNEPKASRDSSSAAVTVLPHFGTQAVGAIPAVGPLVKNLVLLLVTMQ